jgi:hypothetical protein
MNVRTKVPILVLRCDFLRLHTWEASLDTHISIQESVSGTLSTKI